MSAAMGIDKPVRGLRELLAGLADAPDMPVSGLALSSRNVAPGFAFLAVKGTRMHGLAYASEAVARGASVIVFEAWRQLGYRGALDLAGKE